MFALTESFKYKCKKITFAIKNTNERENREVS